MPLMGAFSGPKKVLSERNKRQNLMFLVRFLDIWDELCPLSKEDLAVKCHDAFLSYETPPEIYMKATQLDQALEVNPTFVLRSVEILSFEISWGFLHSRELKVLLGKINLLPQLKSLNANLWDLLTSSLDQITVIQVI